MLKSPNLVTDGWTEDRKPNAQLEGIVGNVLDKYIEKTRQGLLSQSWAPTWRASEEGALQIQTQADLERVPSHRWGNVSLSRNNG